MNGYLYLFVAYAFVWGCLAWYMFSLSKKQKLLHDEMRMLKERLRIRE
jgi:CcmD family protein